MPVPKGYLATEGMAPCGTRTANFGVPMRDIKDLQAYGPEWKFHAARLIPEALKDPTAILEGLKRHGMDDAVCYVTVPQGTWIREGIEGPFPPGRVFLVFAAEKDWGFVVLDWESREADIDDPGCPKNWHEDFERKIWPKNY